MYPIKFLVQDLLRDKKGDGSDQNTDILERKFFVPSEKIGFAYNLLRQVCLQDQEYPKSDISSLYFDTHGLDFYMSSKAGEFRKDKVRIRWYGNTECLQGEMAVFLELKSREGFARRKSRQEVVVESSSLQVADLDRGIVENNVLVGVMAKFGLHLVDTLRPVILISYNRYRFIDILTGARICLDYDIRSSMIAKGLGHGEKEIPLQGGVIEVKGSSWELPETLKSINILDTGWSRFSKYSYCVESHLENPGTVGRLWPYGTVV